VLSVTSSLSTRKKATPKHLWGYSLRLSNKLPVDVDYIDLRIIYYDASGSVMDFEGYDYVYSIPAGLTKTVVVDGTAEATRANNYYETHDSRGADISYALARFRGGVFNLQRTKLVPSSP